MSMILEQRLPFEVNRYCGSYPQIIWDVRLDPYWRDIVVRVAQLPRATADKNWQEIEEAAQLKITRAMWDAYRVGRAMSRGLIA
jgi:hypothetical protein